MISVNYQQQVYGGLHNSYTLHTSQNFYTDILNSSLSLSLLFSPILYY